MATLEHRPRSPVGLTVSTLGHAALFGLALSAVVVVPKPAVETAPPTRLIRLAPAAAAPPPASQGARRRAPRRTASSAVEAIPRPETPPVPITEPSMMPTPTPTPTPASTDLAPGGIPDGRTGGTPEGTPDGDPGGSKGGVRWGVAGGCPGCDGDAPASDWDQPPRPLRQPPPVYPQDAFMKKIEGTVLLEILITVSGEVRVTRVLRSVSPPLDQAAVETVRQWTFVPATRHGRPVAIRAQAPVRFSLY